ncbi:ferredoxin [Pseudofrankia sp. BMG5.37]|uniref:ferredoxin n=1 Tax=Pseudofrankia sp. BMG5.37 TaxID=3050035 RepID=UPI002893CE1E|nr:ferredoxin [Pseudofrankia sp. BMG5.37]MDT3443286.1 ferredoxin [Pseudofrankia sp. BMG5.37]
MRAEVDASACAGHGVCVGHAPDVFELTDEGYSVVRVDEVPAEYEAAVRLAVKQCPTYSITITGGMGNDV